MIIHKMKQNSEEWDAIRLGKFTASSCSDLLMDKKTKGYTNLINKVLEERFTGDPCESNSFSGNYYTDRGHQLEPVAINDFEMKTFMDVEQVGFIEVDSWVGCSPDGLIGDNGMLQIKCPIFATQREYLKIVKENKDLSDNELLEKINKPYYKQMQFELMVADRDYNIFYSYHPKLKAVRLKITRDENLIKEIKERIVEATKIIKKETGEL